jgi:hypothetical protein
MKPSKRVNHSIVAKDKIDSDMKQKKALTKRIQKNRSPQKQYELQRKQENITESNNYYTISILSSSSCII